MLPSGESAAPCQLLEWDSRHFGLRIGRVSDAALSANAAERIDHWRHSYGIDCLYLLASLDDHGAIRLAERIGFQLVDVRLTLDTHLAPAPRPDRPSGETPSPEPRVPSPESRAPSPESRAPSPESRVPSPEPRVPPPHVAVRPARPEDTQSLTDMAGALHRDSRFFTDGRFPEERSRALFAIWMANACSSAAYRVLVAEHDGRVAGYVACERTATGTGRIQLIGVHPDAQRRGLGGALVVAALADFTNRGVEQVTVVTQGRNVAAQRLYQQHGFMTASQEVWYHWWRGRAGDRPSEDAR